MTRLELRGVTHRFGAETVLEDVSLVVAEGEFLVLLGPSGCGKSTLLRIAAGLVAQSAGEVWIDGRRADELEPKERGVALVFQSYALYPHMTVRANLAVPLKMAGAARSAIDQRVERTAHVLGLAELLERKPEALSGGQMQRVALGRALVREPRLFLFDEPLSNLDAKLRAEMRAEIARLVRELGTTALYVTHDQAEAMTMGARIALLQKGVVEQVGPPLELYRRPATRFVASFLGSPAMNLWPGEAAGADARVTGSELRVPAGGVALPAGAFTAGVRPEDVTLSSAAAPGAAAAEVLVVEPMGNETIVTLQCGAARVVARCGALLALRAGDRAYASPANGRAHFFGADGRRLD